MKNLRDRQNLGSHSCASGRNFRSVNLKINLAPQFTSSALFEQVINIAQTDRRWRCSLSSWPNRCTRSKATRRVYMRLHHKLPDNFKGPTGGILDHDHAAYCSAQDPRSPSSPDDPRPEVFPFNCRG